MELPALELQVRDTADTKALGQWLVAAGLDGMPVGEILEGFCDRLVAAAMPIKRVYAAMATLHPLVRAHGYLWQRGQGLVDVASFAVNHVQSQAWSESPFKVMLEQNRYRMRRRLEGPGAELDFPILREFADEGLTDWLALARDFGWELDTTVTFAGYAKIGMVSTWATDRPGGFTAAEIDTLETLVPTMALAIKAATNAQLARNILGTYVGGDAAGHVMSGDIRRGTARRIEAVILYADLRGFTSAADRLAMEPVVAMLNGYFDCLGPAIEQHGGEVLKFLGDGLLASFQLAPGQDPAPVCAAALGAAEAALAAVKTLNAERIAASLPVLDLDIALHHGLVMYGNVGTGTRLDFTLIGPAVNEAARLENLCGTLNRNLLASRSFAAAAGDLAGRLVSLGRHQLRGVAEPREVFGLAGS